MPPETTSPDWDRLYETAAAQEGHFTTGQAAEAGYSAQLLAHYLNTGKMERIRRGVYRLVHFPAGDHEELAVLWLWSERVGVFSHQTALSLHELSDVLPSAVHMTLPVDWRKRRLRVPAGLRLNYSDLQTKERWWFGAVPATSPVRTLEDCAAADLAPDLLAQAARAAVRRGLASRDELKGVVSALKPFGGLDP